MASFWRLATVGIAGAIIIVLGNHWRLALHHVRDLRTNDLILPPHPLSTFRHGHRTNIDASGRYHRSTRSNTTDAKPNHDASYIVSPICGGCFRSRSNGKHCAEIILARQKKNHSSLSDAAAIVGKENQDCNICDIDYCLASHFKAEKHSDQSALKKYQTKYWRFDQSTPKFTNPTSLTLTSIPSELRIPPSRFQDVGAYFQEMYNLTKSGMDFFVEYNPGLVAIPSKMKQNLPEEAVYLLSLRVTSANNCFPTSTYADLPKEVWNSVYNTVTNHLGLVLLDDKYQMIPGYDVVIDVGEQLGLKRPHEGPSFMD